MNIPEGYVLIPERLFNELMDKAFPIPTYLIDYTPDYPDTGTLPPGTIFPSWVGYNSVDSGSTNGQSL